MASGTIYGTTNNKYIDSKIEWSSVANHDDNTSAVTAKLYYKRINSGVLNSGKGTFSITIDGVSKSESLSINIEYNKWVEVMSFTHTVVHGDTGSKSVYISGAGSISGMALESTNCAGRIILDTIPRASTISAAYTTTLGSNCKIQWTPASASFYYKLKFELGTFSYITEAFCPGKKSVYTYTEYPIPLDVSTNFPNALSDTMKVTLYTYSDNGITQVGTASSKTFSVVIPDNESTKPTVIMALEPVTPYEKFKTLYLQGISKVKATLGGEGKYGASNASNIMQVLGRQYKSSPFISDILAASGIVEVVGFSTDSRGLGNALPVTINVLAYSSPYISPSSANNKVICERCKDDGTASESGTFLHVKGKRNYTKINTNGITNACSVRCRYKPEGGTWSHESGNGVGVLLYTNTSTDDFDVVVEGIYLDPQLTYVVELNITDDISIPSGIEFNIPSEDVTFHLRDGGGGAAFGKYANAEDLFDCVWEAKFHKGISINSNPVRDFVVEQGSTDIWYYRKWYSGKAECWGRKSVIVDISTEWGTIYYGTVAAHAFPTGLFTAVPNCQVTADFSSNSQSAWVCLGGSTTKESAPAVMFCRPLISNEANCGILYYAIGNCE